MTDALATSLERLETLLDGSIAAMAARQAIDDRALAEAKGRVLLELSRIAQRGPAPDEHVVEATLRVRDKLNREGELLALRLDAAETIADIVSGAARIADWDGTYNGPAGRGGAVAAAYGA